MARRMYSSSFHMGKKIDSFSKCADAATGGEGSLLHLVTSREPASPLPPPVLDQGPWREPDEHPPLRAGQLTPLWSVLLAVGWGLVMAALIALGTTSSKIGKPAWWVGDHRPVELTWTWFVPFVLPAAALLVASANRRGALVVSGVAALTGAAIALPDLGETPGVAVGQLAVALAAALLTAAAGAGLLRTGSG